jgi:hypothetical protein
MAIANTGGDRQIVSFSPFPLSRFWGLGQIPVRTRRGAASPAPSRPICALAIPPAADKQTIAVISAVAVLPPIYSKIATSKTRSDSYAYPR